MPTRKPDARRADRIQQLAAEEGKGGQCQSDGGVNPHRSAQGDARAEDGEERDRSEAVTLAHGSVAVMQHTLKLYHIRHFRGFLCCAAARNLYVRPTAGRAEPAHGNYQQ